MADQSWDDRRETARNAVIMEAMIVANRFKHRKGVEDLDAYLLRLDHLEKIGSYQAGDRIEVEVITWDGGYNGSGYHWTFKDADGLAYYYSTQSRGGRPYGWPGIDQFKMRATVRNRFIDYSTGGLKGYYVTRPAIGEPIQIATDVVVEVDTGGVPLRVRV